MLIPEADLYMRLLLSTYLISNIGLAISFRFDSQKKPESPIGAVKLHIEFIDSEFQERSIFSKILSNPLKRL